MKGTMRAVRKLGAGRGGAVVDVPIPRVGSNEVLVRVEAASICGTDLHIWNWDDWSASRVRPPITLGHEMAGTVVEVGTGMERTVVGDFVSAESHVTCGVCFQCRTGQAHMCPQTSILGVDRDGCFAEYVAIPEKVLWHTDRNRLPPEIATLQEPFGNAVFSALAHHLTGQSVGVLGCGPIGLFSIAIAKTSGASRVVASDVNDYRLSLARALGADEVFCPSEGTGQETAAWLSQAGGYGVDIVLEMSGAPAAIDAAFKGVRRGGHVSLVGIPAKPVLIDVAEDMIFKNLTVLAFNGRRIFETWYKTRLLLETGVVDLAPLVTHRMPLEAIDEAMTLLARGQAGKVILLPQPA